MAKRIKNRKGFLVLEITRQEMVDRLSRYGSLGVCDSCMDPSSVGYYIAVLNQWFCPKCYERFTNVVDRYKEDEAVEKKNFDFYCKLFNVKKEEETCIK